MTTAQKLETVIVISKIVKAVDEIDNETAALMLELLDKVVNAPSPNLFLRASLKRALGK